MISKSSSRVARLRKKLASWKAGGCLVEAPNDLYYLTGLALSRGRLVITPDDVRLFVDGRYLEMAREKSPFPVASYPSGLPRIARLAFDSLATSFEQAKKFSRFIPVPGLLKEVRAVKDREEIALMQKSAKIAWRGFLHIRKCAAAGVTEEELAWEFEKFCREHGASGLAFEPIIAFGENTAMPHHRAGKRKLKKGDLVLCDLGVIYEHYRSDMTKVFPFGTVDPRLVEIEKVVRAAFRAALKQCRPGTPVGALDAAARTVMREAGMEGRFLHSLGHGIGLETHEFPLIRYDGTDADVRLTAGMIITIEPGLYVPGLGGVRHEETIMITPKGYRSFYA